MGIFSFLKSKKAELVVDPVTFNAMTQEYELREAAFHSCTNLIANAVARCELCTYENGTNKKGLDWYLWNIQPNKHMNATQFWHTLVTKLYRNNEALVIPRTEYNEVDKSFTTELYIADSFTRDSTQAFNLHAFKDIRIDGLNYQPILLEDQVFYFALHDKNIKALTDKIAGLSAKLLDVTAKNYQAVNGSKGALKIGTVREADTAGINKYLNNTVKPWAEAENGVLPEWEGFEYRDLNKSSPSGGDTKDFYNQIDKIFELYSKAFCIPKSLITGEVQDTSKAVDQLLTFCVDPLLELIGDELNRKLYTREKIINGNRVGWKTNAIKHIDLMDIAGNVEKLISSGFCCIDDIRELCGMDRVNTDWSQQYFMTKNFSTIDELLKSIERGEPVETGNTG